MNRREFMKVDAAVLAIACAPGAALDALESLSTSNPTAVPSLAPKEAYALWLMRRDRPVVSPEVTTKAWGERDFPNNWRNGKPQYRGWYGSIGLRVADEWDFDMLREQNITVDLDDIRYFCFLRLVVWNPSVERRELLAASVTSQFCSTVEPGQSFDDAGFKRGQHSQKECDVMFLEAWGRLRELASKYEPVPRDHWMADREITISREPIVVRRGDSSCASDARA